MCPCLTRPSRRLSSDLSNARHISDDAGSTAFIQIKNKKQHVSSKSAPAWRKSRFIFQHFAGYTCMRASLRSVIDLRSYAPSTDASSIDKINKVRNFPQTHFSRLPGRSTSPSKSDRLTGVYNERPLNYALEMKPKCPRVYPSPFHACEKLRE
jgi:hypothetical protein